MKRLIGASVACVVMAGSAMADPEREINRETHSESLEKDALGLVVVGGVTLAASAGFAYASHQKSVEIMNHDLSVPWDGNIFYLEREGQRLENLSIMTGIIGGAFVVTGVVLYWRSRVAAREEHVIVAPMASSSSAGVALSGSF